MEILFETFPFVFGILLGVACALLGGLRRRWPLWLVGSVALGLFATLASGEYRASWLYLLYDVALVAGVCAATTTALARRGARAHPTDRMRGG